MAEIAVAAAGEVAKCSMGHLEREIGYLFHFRRNVNNLNNIFQQLNAEKTVVDQQILAARNNNEVIREPVNTWLTDVDFVKIVVDAIQTEAAQITSLFKGWFCSRFRLGRKANKTIPLIQALVDRRNTFGDTVSDPKPPQDLERVGADDFEDFYSREPLTMKIMKALCNDNICLVGVFGMAGIGKTKLMEVLSRRVKEKKLFDEVVMVTISQNPDVKAIQKNVAKELNMKLDDSEDISHRARILFDRLKQTQDKKILIVLDDVWDELNLDQVGIPKKTDCKSYKIVITTRNEGVCGHMRTDQELKVPVLSKDDSWTLFRNIVGDVVDSRDLQNTARDVVHECVGLPLAIVALGKALRKNNDANVWEDAVRRLKKSINGDLMRVVGSSIKLSYDFLSDDVQKRCFLFCSLFPEDYNINVKEELLVYVVGEKVLEDGVDDFNSLEEAKRRLDSIVQDLISSSLLLRGGYRSVGYIKMHDVVRDVAKMIASEEEGFKQVDAAAGTDLMKWPEKLESCKRLSLMKTKIRYENLPRQVEAPQLLTLILKGSKGFNKLPCDFFKKMKNLKNLDLSDTEIESLPPSISCLVELRTLLLKGCESLKNISPVEKLEILDISRSGIESLAEEMVGMLSNLKSLNMSRMKKLKSISPKVISSMVELEELRVTESFKGWGEVVEMGDNNKINANLWEVGSLANLTRLEMEIRTPKNVESCYSINNTPIPIPIWDERKLKKYTVVAMGDGGDFLLYRTLAQRVVRNRLLAMGSALDSDIDVDYFNLDMDRFQRSVNLGRIRSATTNKMIIWLLRRADCLYLDKCNDFTSVLQVDPTGGWGNNLKCLEVVQCSEMKYLIDDDQVAAEISFTSLEVLRFHELDKLESIIMSQVTTTTLPRGFLHNLRELEISFCKRITRSVISSELLLVGLHNLTTISVVGCHELKWLIDTPSPSPSSTSTSCSSMLPNLRKVEIYSCSKMRYVLPMSVARHLNQLVSLKVVNCSSIEMIIENDNEDDDGDKYMMINILPRLNSLTLKDLPSLVSFDRSGLVFDWECLEELQLRYCPKLSSLPCRVNQQSLSKFKYFELDEKLINLLEDLPAITHNLERVVETYGVSYYKKKAEE